MTINCPLVGRVTMYCPGQTWRAPSRFNMLHFAEKKYGNQKNFTGAQLMRDMRALRIGNAAFYANLEKIIDAGLFDKIEIEDSNKTMNPLVVTECGSTCSGCIKNSQEEGSDLICAFV